MKASNDLREQNSKRDIVLKLRDLKIRIEHSLSSHDPTLAGSFALQLGYLLRDATLFWRSPGNGLVPLLAEFDALSIGYLKKDKMQLLTYLNDCVHRCLCVVDESPRPGEGGVVIPPSLVDGTREYIERIVDQINGCYASGWYDACAVMIRRLIETLIIEAFEARSIQSKIKDSDGNYLYLKDLVPKALDEPAWNLGRNVKRVLPQLKDMGDQSAHSRRFIAERDDVDRVMSGIRAVIQEFVDIANLKR
jgi:hypothetical protein